MEVLDNYSLYNILINLRPSEYKHLMLSSTALHEFISSNKYRLLKYWSKDRRSVVELQLVLPRFTMEQLNYMADYHRPTKFLTHYRNIDLFNNALLDDNVSLARKLFISRKEYVLSAYVLGYPEFVVSHTRIAAALSAEFYDQDINDLLAHKHSSLNMFLDVIYRVYVNDPESVKDIIGAISKPTAPNNNIIDITMSILNASDHPDVAAFCNKVNVKYYPERYVIGVLEYIASTSSYLNSPVIVGAIYHSNILRLVDNEMSFRLSNSYNRIMVALSYYDSYKYPSYDLFHDIASGNYVDAFAKANNWSRDITLTSNLYRLPATYPYISWTGIDSSLDAQIEYMDKQFNITNARSSAGKIMLDKHPAVANNYLTADYIEVDSTPNNYYKLLSKWCFPDRDVTSLKVRSIHVPIALASYYHPTLIQGEWMSDISVLVDRCLELGESDDRILAYLRNLFNNSMYAYQGAGDHEVVNVCICLYVYGKTELIDSFLDILNELYGAKLSLQEGIYAANIMFGNSVGSYSTRTEMMLLNHTYLTPEEKLMFLSKSSDINQYILSGLCGDVDNGSLEIAGGLINMLVDESLVRPVVSKFEGVYTRKLTEVPYLEENIKRLVAGNSNMNDLPLGLIWRETNIFRQSNSYVDDYVRLFNADYQSNIPLINDGKYYEYLRGDMVNYPPFGIVCTSKYGYRLYDPFTRRI